MPMAAAAPIIASAITAGAGAVEANQARQRQKGYINSMSNITGPQGEVANQLAGYAPQFYSQAMQTLDPAAAYYRSAMAGGPQLLAAAAPASNLIGQKYGSVISAERSLYPRSGAGNMLDTAFRAGDEQQNLLNTLRSQAPAGAANIAQIAGGLGAGAAGASRGAAATGLEGLTAGLGATRTQAGDVAGGYSQINPFNWQLTDAQKNAFSTWANGKQTPAGGTPASPTNTSGYWGTGGGMGV